MTFSLAAGPAIESPDKPVFVGVLGPLQILGVTPPTASMMRRTLALLAMRAGEFVPLTEFYGEYWPKNPSKPAQIVQTYVMFLRRDYRVPIGTGHGGYMLAVEPSEVDALRFEILAGRARREFDAGHLLAAQDTLRAAFSLWRGEPLSDVEQGPLLANLALRVADRYAAARALQWEIDLRSGRHRDVVEDLADAVRRCPGREDTVAKLMLALYRSSRRVEALAVFGRLRVWLVEEIGLEPCPELQRLHRQILAGDPVLDWEAK